MTARRITVADVRASFNSNVKNHYIVTYFGRPVANVITPMFYNSGWTADGLTYARAGLAAIGLLALSTPSYLAAVFGCAVFFTCFVLDCVDGNLARLHQSVTYWGKFIDGLSDSIFVMGMPMAVGVGLYFSGESGGWMLAGALATICTLVSQFIRSRLSFMREWMVNQSGPVTAETQALTAPARSVAAFASAIYVNGRFPAALLLLMPHYGRMAFVAALAVTHIAAELIWAASTLAEGRHLLARSRRSIHAAIPKTTATEPVSQSGAVRAQ